MRKIKISLKTFNVLVVIFHLIPTYLQLNFSTRLRHTKCPQRTAPMHPTLGRYTKRKLSSHFRSIAAEDDSNGEASTCGRILIFLSWVLVVLTMPFSLLVCFKVGAFLGGGGWQNFNSIPFHYRPKCCSSTECFVSEGFLPQSARTSTRREIVVPKSA